MSGWLMAFLILAGLALLTGTLWFVGRVYHDVTEVTSSGIHIVRWTGVLTFMEYVSNKERGYEIFREQSLLAALVLKRSAPPSKDPPWQISVQDFQAGSQLEIAPFSKGKNDQVSVVRRTEGFLMATAEPRSKYKDLITAANQLDVEIKRRFNPIIEDALK